MATGQWVPVPASALVGRAAEIAAVTALLTSTAVRLVTVTGPPGVGKTRLAQEVAAETGEQFADGVVWVELAALREPAQVVGEIASAFGFGDRGAALGIGPLSEALARRDVLVVLDNCEHLLDAVPQLSELLASCSQLRILATSRERLHLTVEREYPLAPLAMPTGMATTDVELLRSNPSVALLLACAPQNVQLTARTSQALADICIRLDGLPLAIELAAARLRVFTPSELAFRLEHSAAPLGSSARDRPGRHRDIVTAIAWSHDLLPDNERMVFRRVSVFADPWTLADAAAVAPELSEPDVVAAVESLLDKSLVRRSDTASGDADEARFSFLFSVREYAAARLDESGDADVARRAHLHRVTEIATDWERMIGTEDEAATFASTRHTRLDMLAALEFARREDDAPAILRLASALGWYWYTRASSADVASIQDVIAHAIQAPGIDGDLLAAALLSTGVVSVGLGDHRAAERDLHRAVDVSGQLGDERRLAIANAFLGHALRGRGAYDLAGGRYEAARSIWIGTGSRRGVVWSAYDLGVLAYETGDYAKAEAHLAEALAGFRDLDYPWAVGESAWGLGTVRLAAGRPDEAAGLLCEALLIHDSIADRRGIARSLESLAALAAASGDPAMAARLLGAAETTRTAGGARRSTSEQERVAALDESITAALGRGPADAERHAGQALHPAASIALAAAFAAGAADHPPNEASELTARQRDVAALVAAGRTNRQIGRSLGISEKTAEVHVRNIMERLNTPSRAGVAAWAASHGLTRRSTD